MGYYLYDVNGYVGDVASNNGLMRMSNHVLSATDSVAVRKLFQEGNSLVTPQLIVELKAVSCADKRIRDTILNLTKLLAKCDTIAIISDGMTPDSPTTPVTET
jgi:hypothetical protein